MIGQLTIYQIGDNMAPPVKSKKQRAEAYAANIRSSLSSGKRSQHRSKYNLTAAAAKKIKDSVLAERPTKPTRLQAPRRIPAMAAALATPASITIRDLNTNEQSHWITSDHLPTIIQAIELLAAKQTQELAALTTQSQQTQRVLEALQNRSL